LAGEGARKGHPLNVRLVSFSVDPENDTPEVLAAYGERAKADPAVWSFVTGPTEDMQKIVQQGFKISAVKVEKGAGDFDVIHGNWFILGDAEGNIRGYYSTERDEDMKVLLDDVVRLESEGARR
jgi:protein SCO1/2